jgi:endonuclease-3 related protein
MSASRCGIVSEDVYAFSRHTDVKILMIASRKTPLMGVFQRLLDQYGPQGWWPGHGPLETIIGAILTQNTSWSNAQKALVDLKALVLLNPKALNCISQTELAQIIRSSGAYNSKARKIKAFLAHLKNYYDEDLSILLSRECTVLREELLGLYGIGEETADVILLYAAGKTSFVIDAYTRRILTRLGLEPGGHSYRHYQQWVESQLPANVDLYKEYHALLDCHAKEVCRNVPRCSKCCLKNICPVGMMNAP